MPVRFCAVSVVPIFKAHSPLWIDIHLSVGPVFKNEQWQEVPAREYRTGTRSQGGCDEPADPSLSGVDGLSIAGSRHQAAAGTRACVLFRGCALLAAARPEGPGDYGGHYPA